MTTQKLRSDAEGAQVDLVQGCQYAPSIINLEGEIPPLDSHGAATTIGRQDMPLLEGQSKVPSFSKGEKIIDLPLGWDVFENATSADSEVAAKMPASLSS